MWEVNRALCYYYLQLHLNEMKKKEVCQINFIFKDKQKAAPLTYTITYQ